MSRNFATLEPLELKLPFIESSCNNVNKIKLSTLSNQHWAGGRFNTSILLLAKSCVLNKQSHFLIAEFLLCFYTNKIR